MHNNIINKYPNTLLLQPLCYRGNKCKSMSAKANLSRTDSQKVRKRITSIAKKCVVAHFHPSKDCPFAMHHVCCIWWSDAKKHEKKR